uniref:Myocardin related transcription factor A n=1 Tax=Chinchilla lanigera TaxID=34839 RepID=A0A8C2W367_CHILA
GPPALKSPAAFHEQRRSLERARTEDYLKRKIRSRPERSELVRMHILEETSAEPSLQAKQLKLKRARLADDLNEKIAQRPGPMELVEKNILPVGSSLKEAIFVGQVNYPKVADSSSFDEDSSDALSPEQPASHESQGSVPSPLEARVSEPPPSATSVSPTQVLSQLQLGPDAGETLFVAEQPPLPAPPLLPPSLANGTAVPPAKPTPTLIKQSQPKSAGEKAQRSKKAKELKPKVKKLKYHQYIPPDQKQDKGAPAMDSSYAKILQQQQLFLQLQILNQQQQQHYNYQAILPAPPKPAGEALGSSGAPPVRSLSATNGCTSSSTPGPGALARQNSAPLSGKPGALPANLDDMKVAELKQELKLRSLPVSGTKTELIERLRAYQDQVGPAPAAPKAPSAPSLLSKAGEVVVAFPAARLSTAPALVTAGLAPAEVVVATVTSNGVVKFGSTGSTPPVSPTPSERSLLSTGDENSTPGDAFGEAVTSPLTQLTLQPPPLQVLVKEEGAAREPEGLDKDQMLQEKDRQIEALTRMLRQKQRLVELLRLQLEREKLPHGDLSLPPGAYPETGWGGPTVTVLRRPLLWRSGHGIVQLETAHGVLASPGACQRVSWCPGLNPGPHPPPLSAGTPAPGSAIICMCPGLVPDTIHCHLAEISADFKDPPLPGKEKPPSAAACGSPLAAQPSPTAELPQAAPPPPGSPTLPGRLEDFLESSTGLPLLTGGHEGPESLSLIDDLHSQMLSSSAILDHPPSPMDTSELHFAPEPSSSVGLDLADGHLDSMDWLELSSGGPVLSLAPLGSAAPSLFSTDFLDGHDLQLHWDSCL